MKILTEKDSTNKEDLIFEIIENLTSIENQLIDREMSTKGRLRKSYSKLDTNLRLIQKTLENNIIGENGIKQIDGFLQDFFGKFLEEALQEAQKYEQFYENIQQSEEALNQDEQNPWDDDQDAILNSVDELKNTVANIKESIESKHRQQESVIQKDIETEVATFLESQQNQIKELNRTNMYNIIVLVKKETQFWNSQKENLTEI